MNENEIRETPLWMKKFILRKMEINTDSLINCPLPKPKDKDFIRSLKISKRMKRLIIEKQVKGERSQKIISVINSLVKKKYADDYIFFIFNHYPIGEKYRVDSKSSQKWLQSEIDRSRAYVGHPSSVVVPLEIDEEAIKKRADLVLDAQRPSDVFDIKNLPVVIQYVFNQN